MAAMGSAAQPSRRARGVVTPATLLGLVLLWVFREALALFGGSLAISAALRPLVQRLEDRGVGRGLAILSWYLLILVGVVLVYAAWQLWHSAMVDGAKIYWTAAGKKRLRLKNNGGGYLSFHDPREVLGIGLAKKIDELEIHWPAPSKPIAKFTDVPIHRYIRVAETGGIRD